MTKRVVKAKTDKEKEDVKKWFKTGPIAEISKEDWFRMEPIHRHLYNAYLRQRELELSLETVKKEIADLSGPVMEVLKSNPEHSFSKWAWIETMAQSKPKWKEIALSLNEKKALKLAAEYIQKKFPFLRIKYIHPDKE